MIIRICFIFILVLQFSGSNVLDYRVYFFFIDTCKLVRGSHAKCHSIYTTKKIYSRKFKCAKERTMDLDNE